MTTNRAPATRHRSVFFLLILLVFAFVTPTVPHGHGRTAKEDPVAVFATHPLPASDGGKSVDRAHAGGQHALHFAALERISRRAM